MPNHKSRICLVPRVSGVGGMVSFQHKLAASLVERGIEVSYDLADLPYQAVLVIGGTRHLGGLRQVRRNGIPIVQRLDGMNWMHRLSRGGQNKPSLRLYLRSEYGNRLLSSIRGRLASRIVYQSEFVRGWWERLHGPTRVPNEVIYNGVDLKLFSPHGNETPPSDHCRVLLVEGSLAGGYELGVEFAVQFARRLAMQDNRFPDGRIELVVVGKTGDEIIQRWEREMRQQAGQGEVRIIWHGVAQEGRIPEIDRSAHLLYAADIQSACPNSVIEAMACGLPVVAFDTGALPELVTPQAGRLVPYGADAWKLEQPDFYGLAQAAGEILQERERYSQGARQRAKAAFDLERMVDAYLEILLES